MFFDIIMSSSMICRHGIEVELNPLIRFSFLNYSLWFALSYVLAYSIQIYIIFKFYDEYKIFRIVYKACIGLYFIMAITHVINYIG